MARARIRTVKPEMLDDEKVAALPHLVWRLFVSLIMTADDYGNQHGAIAKIRGTALWATDATDDDIREALARLSRDSLVALYEVRGQAYVAICGWSKHQKVDKPGKPIVPGREQADSQTCDIRENLARDSREPRENLAPDQDQERDQEKEKEREQAAAPPLSLPLFGDQDAPTPASSPQVTRPDAVADLWAEQERLRREVIPGCRGLDLTVDRRKRIAGLLKSGHSVDSLRACLAAYADEIRAGGDSQWLNGESNWRPDNVTRTLGRIGARGATRPGSVARESARHQSAPPARRTPIRDL